MCDRSNFATVCLKQVCLGTHVMTKPALSEVSFGPATIQKLRRIALDSNLLRTLGLEEGDTLEVCLLVETGEIRLRKHDGTKKKAAEKKRARRQ